MPERYSRAKIRMRRVEDEDKWFIGFDYIIFFLVVGFGAVFTMVLNTDTFEGLVMVSVYQMLFALIGFVSFFFATMYPTNDARSGFPTKDDVSKMVFYFIVLFPILLIVTTFITVTMAQSLVSPNMQIVLTSAISEEALFAAGGGVLLYKAFYYLLSKFLGEGKSTRLFAELIASGSIAALFAVLHVGVYGLAIIIMTILFVNRFVYQLAYYRTRNIMLPTLMHLVNNWLALALSLLIIGG